MSLIRCSEAFNAYSFGVAFPMQDAGRHVVCCHTRAGFEKILGAGCGGMDLGAAFLGHRSAFENLARALYDIEDAPRA